MKHVIKSNDMFSIDVDARESDEYTRSAYLTFHLNYHPEKIRGTHELFMTTEQLRELGHFLVNEAKMIEADQKFRDENPSLAQKEKINKELEARGAIYRLG